LYIEYGTGLAFEIPEGYVGLLFPRSSASNYDLILSNCVGVVDSGYRGEVKFRFKHASLFKRVMAYVRSLGRDNLFEYEISDKVGQLIIMPYPKVRFIEAEELSKSDR